MHWNIQTQDFQVKKTYMTSIIYTQDILMKQVYKVDMWLFTKQNGFQCFFVMTAQPLCCYKWRNWSGRKGNQPSPLRCFLYFVAYVYSSLLFISWNPLTELMVAEGAELERNQMACDFHCSHTVSEESHELLLPQLLTLFPLGPVLEVSYHWTQGGGGVNTFIWISLKLKIKWMHLGLWRTNTCTGRQRTVAEQYWHQQTWWGEVLAEGRSC